MEEGRKHKLNQKAGKLLQPNPEYPDTPYPEYPELYPEYPDFHVVFTTPPKLEMQKFLKQ